MKVKILENRAAAGWLGGLLAFGLLATGINHLATNHKTQQQIRKAQAQQTQAKTVSPTEPLVISLTTGVWSDWVELPTVISGGHVFYLGPKGAQMEFSDGTKFFLDSPEKVGIKFPRFRFLSPTAGEVKVIQRA